MTGGATPSVALQNVMLGGSSIATKRLIQQRLVSTDWVEALGSMHRLVRFKREATGDPKLTPEVIRRLFGARLTKNWAGKEMEPRVRLMVSQLRPCIDLLAPYIT